jgi:hypothetical protein
MKRLTKVLMRRRRRRNGRGEFFGDSLLLDVSFAFLPPPVPFLFASNDLIANHLNFK